MFRDLTNRINRELVQLEKATITVHESLVLAQQQSAEARFFIAAAAFEMHSFYTGVEKIFEAIVKRVDQQPPRGSQWHSLLLNQMSQPIPDVRPAVIAEQTLNNLREFLAFRHVIRNIYVFNLRHDDVVQLAQKLPPTFTLLRHDLSQFVDFLENID